MGGDERRPLAAGIAERLLEPVVHVDEGAAADGQRVRGEKGIEVVVGQLETVQQEQAVVPCGARRLRVDLRDVGGVVFGVDSARRHVGSPPRIVHAIDWSVTQRTSKPLRP